MTRFEIDYMVMETDRLIVLDDLDSAATVINELAQRNSRDTLVLFRQGIINRKLDTVEGRKKSVRAFRRLVDISPENASYHLELARTLIAQTFEHEGRIELARAIELEPLNEEPYLLLASLYQRPYYLNDFEDRAESALVILTSLLNVVPESDSGWLLLAEMCAIRLQLDSAESAAGKALAKPSTTTAASLVLGYCNYLRREYDKASEHFVSAIAQMDSTKRIPYKSIAHLIPPQNSRNFRTLSQASRDSLTSLFWQESDIDPTTEVNERLVEHYARVWLANLLFSNSRYGVEGWTTDMGETLIRLGLPDDRKRTKIHSGRTSGIPAWYWYYSTTQIPCTLAFVDHMLSGKYNFPFSSSDHTGSLRTNASKEVAYLNYSQIPHESTIERDRIPIDITTRVFEFASKDSIADVYILSKSTPESPVSENELEFRLTISSAKLGVLERVSGSTSSELRNTELSARDTLIEASHYAQLPAGKYDVNLALEDHSRNLFGLTISSITASDYRKSGLSMSDLILSQPDNGASQILSISRGDSVQIAPSLDMEFSISKPIRLYYELYHLPTDIRSQTRYDVTYSLQFIKGSDSGLKALLGKIFPGKKESVSYTYREGGKSKSVARDIELDISELRPGRYVLSVEVNELVIGGTASRELELTLFD